MKHKIRIILLPVLLGLLIFAQDLLAQGIAKEMTVGYVHFKVVDQADEGEGSFGWGANSMFWDGYSDNSLYSSKAVMLACKNWTDENGDPSPVPGGIKVSGHGQWEVDDQHIIIPIPDEAGNTINRYYRAPLPELVVDGLPISTFFPQNSADHVAPEKIPGTADGLIESYVNTDMGISFKQRVIGFSQQNHNKYVIKEYIFKNTGNIDADDEIELNQTIEGFYFLKQLRYQEWPQRPWASAVGQFPGDEVRMIYGYPTREPGSELDNLGGPNVDANGYLTNPIFMGEALLFASAAPNDFVNDRPAQPHMTGFTDVDFPSFTFHSWNMTTTQKSQLYEVMENGLVNVEGINWPELEGTVPGTHHGVPIDQMGIPYITEMPGFGYSSSGCYSIGPYDLAPGDSIKVVIADCMGGISPDVSREISKKWWNNEDPGVPAGWENDAKLPLQYQDFPELYAADERDAVVNLNKDKWILSGKDSLLQTARAAKWAYDNNYNVPLPPPGVSVSVTGLANGIRIEWGKEADSHPGLAGFNIYRAEGNFYPGVPYGESDFIGEWEKVYTASTGEHEFTDSSPSRAVAYFYAVTAFDDGGAGVDFDGISHVLESNPYNSVTTFAANLQREAGSLAKVVIVPNPYNVAANALLYPGENNKIAFLDVPQKCTIRIFSESGDLIKTIEHDGSGDAYWGDIPNEHQTTETGQLVVSGVYIVQFETPDGGSQIKKLIIVR